MTPIRYSTADVLEVTRLADAGWSRRDIQRMLLRDQGYAPSLDTMSRWLSPTYADRRRSNLRDWNGRLRAERGYTFRLANGRDTEHLHRAFAIRLRQEGEPVQGIARVCGVVFGGRWTADRVRKLIAESAS